MPPQDALEPLIHHVGALSEALVSPVTAGILVLLAFAIRRRPRFLLAAALVGASDASVGVLAGVSPVGLGAATALGAVASLLQGCAVWPFARFLRRRREGATRAGT